jgi:hypothetical protein
MITITITNTIASKVGGSGGVPPSPPSDIVAPLITGTPIVGQVITCSDGTWSGTAPITYSYQWKNNGIDISGEVSNAYTVKTADYGDTLTCEVTATNVVGSASASSNSVVGTATAPANITSPSISGSNVVGQTLTVTDGDWSGAPTPTYSYQWKRAGSSIGGATSSTYALVQADATFAITCTVTATNVAGSVNKDSSNSLTILDADANAFLTAASITDNTIVNAVNQLFVSLKGYSIYNKMYALHLYVGGTSSTHKWNAVNPLDTNAAYRIVWNGGVTHNANGVTGNGTNGYGETYLQPSTALTQNNTHIAFYSRTNSTQASSNAEMGITDGTLNASLRICSRNGSNQSVYSINDNTVGIATSITDSTGFWIASRTASNVRKLYRNGSSINSSTNASVARSTSTIPVLGQKTATNTMNHYSIKNFALSSTGESFNDTEAANYYTAVQAFQTALGRQV